MKTFTNRILLAIVIATLAGLAYAGNHGFVKVSGTRFTCEGTPYYFAGANLWQGMNLGMSDANGGDRARLCRELDRLQDAGIVNLRVMAASEGPDTEPYRMVPSLQPSAGVFNEAVFEGLDYLLHEMNKRGMRAVMQLNNYWHWSGGMAQYVSWAEGSSIPYPPSYPDFTGNWSVFMSYSARFYANAQCQTAFRACIRAVVERTNTLSGVPYKDDPTVFSWELANEPRSYPAAWIDTTAAYIKSLDMKHLVTCGSEGDMGGDFIETHNGSQIDYATCHIWPQNWGWYNPANPATYATARQNTLAYLASHADRARNTLGKPLVLEEFGLARDGGSYDPDSPTTYRDAFFRTVYAAVFTNALFGGALGGDNLWAWSGEGMPADPAPQWSGDPPHEHPGWYSVYDMDSSTMLVLSEHAAQMAVLSDDSDRDQLPDSWELTYFDSLTNTAGGAEGDWDRDGMADRDEYYGGTSPVDPLDYLALKSLHRVPGAAGIILRWHSVAGRLYTVGTTTNLFDAFVDLPDFTDRAGTGGIMAYTNNPGFDTTRFYRLKARLPE